MVDKKKITRCELGLRTLPTLPERTTGGEHGYVVDTLGTLFNLRMSLPRLQFIPYTFWKKIGALRGS